MHARRPPTRARLAATSGGGRSGFSLLEVVVVLGLVVTAAAAAMVTFPAFQKQSAADSEAQRIAAALRRGRELAITERRNVVVQFPGSSWVRLARQDVSAGVVTGTTEVATVVMESGFTFHRFADLPDTPDAFGAAAPVAFGSATATVFTSEGALVDQTGDPVNGTVFIGQGEDPMTARAITVLGTTGLVTSYRWDGRQWTR